MLTVISPAKRLDWADRDVEMTEPAFRDDAVTLARAAKRLSRADLAQLMDLSDDLAKLNADRFKRFEDEGDNSRPAALAFAGDTYQGLEAASLDAEDMRFAQDRLRILSGLYGILRPLDTQHSPYPCQQFLFRGWVQDVFVGSYFEHLGLAIGIAPRSGAQYHEGVGQFCIGFDATAHLEAIYVGEDLIQDD